MKPIYKFFAEDINGENEVEGVRAPYFYIHGWLEELSGYDIVSAEAKMLKELLVQGVSICEVQIDNIRVRSLVFKEFNGNRMEGLIIALNDIMHHKDYVQEFINKHGFHVYECEKTMLRECHPEIYRLLSGHDKKKK